MMSASQVTAKVRGRIPRLQRPFIFRLYYGNDACRDESFNSLHEGLEFGKLWTQVEPYYRSFELIQVGVYNNVQSQL